LKKKPENQKQLFIKLRILSIIKRFWVNEAFFNATSKNAPVFVYIGGEAPEYAYEVQYGAWINYGMTYVRHKFLILFKTTK
jgi:hypothetical protein